ncbi:2OG-Fe(II) oxygenase [Noviherbaspirillum sp. UKPF54]|uniref:2OG-Fe(II) oxygenase n=1 Tax=Noviherbaspirillum sp. UKPF54 TaxID=2601898 RepID=UPI0011B189F6|nr:2OG-Fe(II) oxygenase [Noviherbaspirillum sp. UKPF54]QDZ27966.1 proline hydroxylase [Noviherbaspirillum sp. UKPF54]
MTTLSALASLPQEWQLWINQNLARACTPRSMAEVMTRDGRFDQRLAHAAIEEARRARFPDMPGLQARPEVNTSANTITTPDRTVNVLLTLKAPRIVLLGNVLSDEECDALVAYSEQRMLRSPVVGDAEGKNEIHAYRTSRGAMLQRGESELVGRIEARLAALTRWPAERGEGLQVLRYESGNEYRPHYDWFDPGLPGPRKHLERGGQRVATIVMYLSDVERGGATSFPNIGLEVQPKKGCAVFFANVDAYGTPDQQTLHAGEPVVAGRKVIATKWLRERAYV